MAVPFSEYIIQYAITLWVNTISHKMQCGRVLPKSSYFNILCKLSNACISVVCLLALCNISFWFNCILNLNLLCCWRNSVIWRIAYITHFQLVWLVAVYDLVCLLSGILPGEDKLSSHDFYRAMLRRARLCLSKSSVRPSICLSVCDVQIYFSHRLELGILRK